MLFNFTLTINCKINLMTFQIIIDLTLVINSSEILKALPFSSLRLLYELYNPNKRVGSKVKI